MGNYYYTGPKGFKFINKLDARFTQKVVKVFITYSEELVYDSASHSYPNNSNVCIRRS